MPGHGSRVRLLRTHWGCGKIAELDGRGYADCRNFKPRVRAPLAPGRCSSAGPAGGPVDGASWGRHSCLPGTWTGLPTSPSPRRTYFAGWLDHPSRVGYLGESVVAFRRALIGTLRTVTRSVSEEERRFLADASGYDDPRRSFCNGPIKACRVNGGAVGMTERTSADELLGQLNDRQREAVRHGDEPLLIIAGAGTGKTNTLVHRVAYRIRQGVPPRRMLLLTFTRRAAAEMLRRVDGLLRQFGSTLAARGRPGRPAEPSGAGPFTRPPRGCSRLYGPAIGLGPDFTILDRSDAEDLLDVVRTELGLAKTNKRFPAERDLPGDLQPLRECPGAVGRRAGGALPLVPGLCRRAEAAVPRLRRTQGTGGDAGLRRPAAVLARPAGGRAGWAADPQPVRLRAGGRVPGHEPRAGRDPPAACAGRPRLDRGGRRRPVDLLVPRGDGPQHPGLSQRVSRARRSSSWSRTTAAPSRSWRPRTGSSPRPASGTPRICGRPARVASCRR